MARVLFVSKPIAPPFHDGTKCLVRDVALHLTRHHAVVMTAKGAPPLPGSSSVAPELVPVYSDPGAFTPQFSENARAALWLLTRARADVLHFVFAPNPLTSTVGKVCRAVRRIPVVQTIASPPRTFAPGVFFGDCVVAQSRWTKDRVVGAFESAGRPPPRVEVVPPPAPEVPAPSLDRVARVRRVLEIEPNARVVVYPGDLETSTGASRVADIVADVTREVPDAVVVFACRHKTPRAAGAEAALRARLHGMPVRFAAELDLHALFAASTVLLFPVDDLYGKVDLPISLLEAMRLGLPVIAADEGPLGDLAGATLVPLDDPGALVRETVAMCRDGERRRRAAEQGSAAVDARYDAGIVAEAYERLYDQLLQDE